MKPLVPFYPRTSRNLDLDEVNENLSAIARDINRNVRKRYTYPPPLSYSYDGITNASDASLRKFYIRRPAASHAVEIIGIDLVLYTNAAVTATLSCSDTSWPDLTTTTSATTTTEVVASSRNHVSVASESSDLTFTLSFSGAVTVTAGKLVVYLRIDRGAMGTTLTEWTADQYLSTATSGGLLGTNLTASFNAAAAVATTSRGADKDIRCECITVRGEAAGATFAVRLPGGARRKLACTTYNVQTAGGSLAVDIDGDSDTVNGAGATTLAASTNALSGSATDAPMTTASDTIVTFTVTAQTVELGYILLWWS